MNFLGPAWFPTGVANSNCEHLGHWH